MNAKSPNARELPAELLDDERSWQGDNDPYLATLALEGRKHRAPPAGRAPRVEGPVDDGDLYLAQLTRLRDAGSDGC